MPVVGDMLRRLARMGGGRPSAPATAVLVYHGLAESASGQSLFIERARFSEQIEAIRRWFRPLSLAGLQRKLAEGRVPRLGVVVTFDDGYRDTLEYAASELQRFGMTATAFLVTGALDRRIPHFWWDELAAQVLDPDRWPEGLEIELESGMVRASRSDNGLGPRALYRHLNRYCKNATPAAREDLLQQLRARSGPPDDDAIPDLLRADDLARLGATGTLEFGVHSATHPVLGRLREPGQRVEIAGARARLRELGGGEARAMAYPFGAAEDFTGTTVDVARRAGFDVACSTVAAPTTGASDPLRLPRLTVGNWSGEHLSERLARLFLAGEWQ